MDGFQPFRPSGSTSVIPAQPGTAPSATLMGSGLSGDVAYLVYNPGAIDCWMGYGPTSTVAQSNSVIPIIGTPSAALPVPGGSLQTFTLVGRQFFSGITQLGSCSVFVTPGQGA